jgi:hypothetical protein
VVLALPDAEALKASTRPVTSALEALERGLGTARTEKSATLVAMLKAFSDAAASGRPGMECVEAAIEAANEAPLSAEEIAALAPHAPLQAMILAATSRALKAPSTPAALYAGDGGRAEETRAFIERSRSRRGFRRRTRGRRRRWCSARGRRSRRASWFEGQRNRMLSDPFRR